MPTAPRAPQRPFEITRHGETRTDPYFWLRDRENPEVIAHLRAENEYLTQYLAPLAPLESTIFGEIKDRIQETDISLPVRKGRWWYYERTREGLDYPISCRVAAASDEWTPPDVDAATPLEGEQILLDENLEAVGHDFLSVGVFAVSPDDLWVAIGVDFDGSERHSVSFRSLTGQPGFDDVLHDVSYGFAWGGDSRHVFYTRVDDAMRPFQVWRHEVGTDPATDVLVFQEDDPLFNVSLGRSRDDEMLFIMSGSSTTSEMHYLEAATPTRSFSVIEPRRSGVDYVVEYHKDASGTAWWLSVTNDGATDFKMLARPLSEQEWTEIIPHRPGVRLEGVDSFTHFLAVSERVDGCAAVRILPLGDQGVRARDVVATSYLVDGGDAPTTVVMSANAMVDTPYLRVMVTSLVTPRLVADVEVATGEVIVRKQQNVHGYDPEHYVTGRLWVSASDGVMIPVSVVASRNVAHLDSAGNVTVDEPAPLLLYGYGAYEISIDPGFSSLRLSLLDRGVIFAIAHVRGGGEMGRAWYEMGRLSQKPTTFSDFVRVAHYLVDSGWTTPSQMAFRGGSAGGLLMGAVMNLAPDLCRAVVAEVPFVDVVTTMLDATLPLTVVEWEEWGNPDADPVAYATMMSYSPYDNVRSTNVDGSDRVYPRLYAAGGLNDSRVSYWEPAKWVLKIRDAHRDNVAIMKTEMGAGHGGPSGRYDTWHDEAQVLAFILDAITTE